MEVAKADILLLHDIFVTIIIGLKAMYSVVVMT